MHALQRRAVITAALGLVLPARAGVQAPSELAQALPGAALQGEGRLSFIGLPVYDARLWASSPVTPGGWAEQPLALELRYLRKLDGRRLAERSLEEMQRQTTLPPERAPRWLDTMTQLFPDVADGDRLTGVLQPARGAQFFFNGMPRGTVDDPLFARLFFGIWLAPQTSEPGLRERLIGPAR